MIEIEKLRALLAEAREWFGVPCGSPCGESSCVGGLCGLRSSIDAALAETDSPQGHSPQGVLGGQDE